MTRSRLLTLALVLLLPLTLSAGVRVRYGGELRVLVPALPQTFDPALASSPGDLVAARLLFDPLFSSGEGTALTPSLALSVPEPEAQGRLFRLKLRPGLKFQDGLPLSSRDVVETLVRLNDPALGSPFAALALPLVGSREGASSGKLSGLAMTSELELQASLAFPYPDWLRGLAHPAAGIVQAHASRTLGTGPFRLSPRVGEAGPRFAANDDAPGGRPFADTVRLVASDSRGAAKALQLGEAEIAMLAVPDHPSLEGAALFTSYVAFNPRRLGVNDLAVRRAVEAAVTPAELARVFARAPAWPMYGLLPPLLDASSATATPAPARPAPLPSGSQVVLIADASVEDHKRVAERYQIKLHDLGVSVDVRRMPRAEFRAALASGSYDLALLSFAAIPEPGLALAQLVNFALGPDAARDELKLIGAGADLSARRALASGRALALRATLPLHPLYVQAPRLVTRAGISPLTFDAAGAPGLADAWLNEPKKAR